MEDAVADRDLAADPLAFTVTELPADSLGATWSSRQLNTERGHEPRIYVVHRRKSDTARRVGSPAARSGMRQG
jgi:hypothetical protein